GATRRPALGGHGEQSSSRKLDRSRSESFGLNGIIVHRNGERRVGDVARIDGGERRKSAEDPQHGDQDETLIGDAPARGSGHHHWLPDGLPFFGVASDGAPAASLRVPLPQRRPSFELAHSAGSWLCTNATVEIGSTLAVAASRMITRIADGSSLASSQVPFH